MKDQILSFVSKLDEVESFVVHLAFRMLHAHEMDESFLKLSEPKLKKKKNDQMVSLIRSVNEVTRVAGDMERIRAFCQIWVSELRVMLHETEDCVNDFMIKVYGQTGRDRKQSIVEFRSELENVNSAPAKQSQLHANYLSIKAPQMHGHPPVYHPEVHVPVILLILQLLMSKLNLSKLQFSKLQSLNLILKTSILK